jgi:hypothetical protein
VLNLHDDRSHRLVRHVEIASDGSQTIALDLSGNVTPLLPRDARPLGYGRIPANPRSPSRVEQSFRIQERDKGQLDHVYLAEPIPVASAHTSSRLTIPQPMRQRMAPGPVVE